MVRLATKDENGKNLVLSRPVRISTFILSISVFTEKYRNGTEAGRGVSRPY